MTVSILAIAISLTVLICSKCMNVLDKDIVQMSILVLISEVLCETLEYITDIRARILIVFIAFVLMLIAVVKCTNSVKSRINKYRNSRVWIPNRVNAINRHNSPTTAFVIISTKISKSRLKWTQMRSWLWYFCRSAAIKRLLGVIW